MLILTTTRPLLPRRIFWLVFPCLVVWPWLLDARPVQAQRYPWQNEWLNYRRSVRIEAGRQPAVAVTEFFTHGQLASEKPTLAVYPLGKSRQIPWRLLQAGPGDFCRIAFQPSKQSAQYFVYYDKAVDESSAFPDPPAWTETAGLLMETHHWKNGNVREAKSVRGAFRTSSPFGGDYVSDVFHRSNPFNVKPAPFMSRYQGTLNIDRTGKYAFFTSSQDCSFLLIDGKQVVAAPGRHRPVGRARIRGEVVLRAGPHRFEYLHAATGNEACMVAAWQPPGADRPTRIPPELFRNDKIARAATSQLEHRTKRLLPDFQFITTDEIPIKETNTWMVRVRFTNTTSSAIASSAKCSWDFGDGQTSDESEPAHVFLHPGEYRIALNIRYRGKRLSITNTVHISRPIITAESKHTLGKLDDYLPLLATYDPVQLDSEGALQLIQAFLQADDPGKAAAEGQAVLKGKGPPRDDQFLWQMVQLIGPVLRDRLGDSQLAFQLWRDIGQKIQHKDFAAKCAIEAADIAISELLQRDSATPLLKFAADNMDDMTGDSISQLRRVQGDWYARGGQAKKALAAYNEATVVRTTHKNAIRQNAWRGARSRSTEALLRDGELDRVRNELRQWQKDFPADKSHGYFSLLLARYWIASNKLPNAITVANDLLMVNQDSPYADRLLFLSATCEVKRGNTARAAAAYESLLTDYPGSPLVKTAKERLAKLKEE